MDDRIETRSNLINWGEVPMDTKVLVSYNNIDWYERYFYSFLDGKYLCFNKGRNSTNYDPYARKLIEWNYCKLYQE